MSDTDQCATGIENPCVGAGVMAVIFHLGPPTSTFSQGGKDEEGLESTKSGRLFTK